MTDRLRREDVEKLLKLGNLHGKECSLVVEFSEPTCAADQSAVRAMFAAAPALAATALALMDEREKWNEQIRKCIERIGTQEKEILHERALTEAAEAEVAALKAEQAVAEAVKAERERCARVGYRVCAETRHVTLGRAVEDAIRRDTP